MTTLLAHDEDNISARLPVCAARIELVNELPVGSAAPTDSDSDADRAPSAGVRRRESIVMTY
jgi:hypothetical protein